MNDVVSHNAAAWNRESRSGESRWCQPVTAKVIADARRGDWNVILTPTITTPKSWFEDVRGKRVLCLASAGGQQAPVIAAAGADVTSFDISDEQLAKDGFVADREGLHIKLVQGDMADLSCFAAAEFDLIFNPVSNVFVPDARKVWGECRRILVESGRLLSGFMNPDFYLFDHAAIDAGGALVVKNRLPYADVVDLCEEELSAKREQRLALEFSHSLDVQIGGQLAAGFLIAGFYEDRWEDAATALNAYMPTSMATLAIRGSLS